MSCMLHAAKVYTVDYGVGQFNHNQEEFESLYWDRLSAGYHTDYGDTYEVYPADLTDYIAEIRLLPDVTSEYFSDMTNAEVATDLQVFIDEYDKTNDYIRLEWY